MSVYKIPTYGLRISTNDEKKLFIKDTVYFYNNDYTRKLLYFLGASRIDGCPMYKDISDHDSNFFNKSIKRKYKIKKILDEYDKNFVYFIYENYRSLSINETININEINKNIKLVTIQELDDFT